jgi:hypothetical protein
MIRRIALSSLLVFCLAGAVVAQATADRGASHVAGTYTVSDFGTTTCDPLGTTSLVCRTTGFRIDYDGDLDGLSTSSFDQVIDCARGRTMGRGSETFTGSVNGVGGTLTWQLVFVSDFDCASFFPSNLRIVAVPTEGGGALAGTHGVLLFGDTDYTGVLG